MKKPSRFLRVLGAAGLLISLLAVTITPVAAQDEGQSQDFLDYLVEVENAGFLTGNNTIFYPWVANDDDFGLGAADTSISVQNLEDQDTIISIFVGNGQGGFDLVTAAYLSAYASKTFSASALGIASGDGAPVMVASFNAVNVSGFPAAAGVPEEAITTAPAGTVALVETPVILSNPVADDEVDGENDGGDTTQVIVCVVNSHTSGQPGLGNAHGYVDAATGNWVSYSTQAELQETLNAANAGNTGELINPFAGLNNDGDCFDVLEVETLTLDDSVAIGGVALQTAEAAAPGNGGDESGENGDDANDDGVNDENGDDANGDDATGENGDDANGDGVDSNDGDDTNGDATGENGDTDEGANLEQFTTTATATSGYNAVNGVEIAYFDEWYLPIVQTNCGPGGCWDSMLRVANYDSLNNAVTIRFFPADDGSGSLQTGFQIQALVNGGDTWHVNLGDLVPEGWVGSAHILSDGAVFAMVDRYKVGYNMWITNTGSSADFENLAQVENNQGRYALFAPHVLLDYFGWNTGINVANLAGSDNNISIQYFNLFGNATQVLNQRLAAHGMTYFYDPSIAAQDNNQQDVETDPNAGIVGSAIIWSDLPVAAAVDATKYPETDPNGGADLFQATSYSATANVFPWQAVPYVTKGNPTDGSGPTSGINIMNPNSVAATANVAWVNPSGFQGDNFGTSSVTIPAFANGFVYTLWQHNLPNGFLGAAQVVANVPVAAVSANVNYDVEGDGGAIFNAFNPCGLYRVAAACSFGDVLEPGGQSVTKTFVDEDGDPVQGVNFSIASTSGAGYQRDAVTGPDGSAILTNVPVGTYDLEVNAVPLVEVDGETVSLYLLPEGVQETFVVSEGEDVVLENQLLWNQGFVKTVCVGTHDVIGSPVPESVGGDCTLDEDEEAVGEVITTLAGIDIVVYEILGEDGSGEPVIGEAVFEGQTGADGTVSGGLAPGDYILCMYDADGEAVTSNGETVEPFLPEEFTSIQTCIPEVIEGIELDSFGDLFTVTPGAVTELENPVYLQRGAINMIAGIPAGAGTGIILTQSDGEDLDPVEGVEVCIYTVYADFTNLPELLDYQACATSDSAGNLTFLDAPGYTTGWPTEPVNQLSAPSLQQVGPTIITEDEICYVAVVTSAGDELLDAEGGELTAVPDDEGCLFLNVGLPFPVPEQFQDPDISFWYSPTADVLQDGYSNDEGQNDGTYELSLGVAAGDASLDVMVYASVGGNNMPLHDATVTVYEGTCEEETGVIAGSFVTEYNIGLASFVGLDAGDYCVEVVPPDISPDFPFPEGSQEQNITLEEGDFGELDFTFTFDPPGQID